MPKGILGTDRTWSCSKTWRQLPLTPEVPNKHVIPGAPLSILILKMFVLLRILHQMAKASLSSVTLGITFDLSRTLHV